MFFGLLKVMRCDHHSHFLFLQCVEQVEQSLLSGRVKTGQRLVHQHQFGFLRQGAGDEHSLLLSA